MTVGPIAQPDTRGEAIEHVSSPEHDAVGRTGGGVAGVSR